MIISRSEHNISRKNISTNALKVLYRLQETGYAAYLVGGGVRDLLLGLHPKDFDIATDARPEQIRKLFGNCMLIGRRFRLAHVRFGREIIEVATFRAETDDDAHISEDGMLLRDNVYGEFEEDAWRRDFSVNALYYNIADFSIVDFTGGMQDIKDKKIRVIGEPLVRFKEDPVRMVRALRLAAKLDLSIDQITADAIKAHAHLLQNVSIARLYDEISKWFVSGKSFEIFKLLEEYGLFAILFPQVAESFTGDYAQFAQTMIMNGFKNTDRRIHQEKPVNPAFLYAVLLWWPLQRLLKQHKQHKHHGRPPRRPPVQEAFAQAMQKVLSTQNETIAISQRLRMTIKDIWVLQHRLTDLTPSAINQAFNHPKFRAAYDFLLLRAEAGEPVKEAAEWWTETQNGK